MITNQTHKTIRTLSIAVGMLMLLLPCACSRRSYSSVGHSTAQSQTMWNRVGTELASLAQKHVKGDGTVLLIRSTTNAIISVEQDAIETSFKKSLKSLASKIDVMTIPDAPRAPEQISAMMPAQPMPLNSAWLSNAVREHKAAVLVVSLVGEPDAQPAGGVWPPTICFAPAANPSVIKQLISSSVVAGAIVPRHANPKTGEKDWFEIRYTVITKDNIASW